MATSLRWTIADVEALPDSLDDRRYEIIDGELFAQIPADLRQILSIDTDHDEE